MGFQHLSYRNERKDHCRRLEIEFHHIVHDSSVISCYLRSGHFKQRKGAVQKGRGRTECHQRIHIRCAVPQTFKSGDEKLLIDHHNDHRQQKLGQPHRHMVIVVKMRKRPAPHHMSHGKVHENDQKSKGRK